MKVWARCKSTSREKLSSDTPAAIPSGTRNTTLSFDHETHRETGTVTNVARHRFVFSPTAEVDQRLKKETAELKTDIESLNKKLHYLETTHKNSREHIDQIFKSGGRA